MLQAKYGNCIPNPNPRFLFHPLIECAQVYSFLRSPCIFIVVYSLHVQFQTQIPFDIILLSKNRAFSNEMSKFPIGYDAEVTSDHMVYRVVEKTNKLHLQVVQSSLGTLILCNFLKVED